ncbi:hypothetical protein HMI54_007067 [Coelomomyces lativittatus]|nr:hypothetical protein HMI54_007067 [Coelomomyces lativittatus]
MYEGNPHKGESWVTMLQVNTTLKRFHVSQCHLPFTTLINFNHVLPYTSIISFRINGNGVGYEQGSPTLRHDWIRHLSQILAPSSSSSSSSSKGDDGQCQLIELGIAQSQLQDFQVLDTLALKIKGNTVLKVLDISKNDLRVDGVTALLDAFRFTHLTALDLSYTYVFTSPSLFTYLFPNLQLQSLHLQHCHLPSSTLLEFLHLWLQHDSVLHHLALWGNQFDSKVCEQWHQAFYASTPSTRATSKWNHDVHLDCMFYYNAPLEKKRVKKRANPLEEEEEDDDSDFNQAPIEQGTWHVAKNHRFVPWHSNWTP